MIPFYCVDAVCEVPYGSYPGNMPYEYFSDEDHIRRWLEAERDIEKFKERLPGLKFNRTLWVCAVSGGPYEYTAKDLHDAHFELHIPPEVFDEVAAELGRALDHFKVPKREKEETLAAFNAQKSDVTAGSMATVGR